MRIAPDIFSDSVPVSEIFMSRAKTKSPLAKRLRTPAGDEEAFRGLFCLASLKKTWSTLRKELRQVPLRDAVDWIDWVHTVDGTLPFLVEDILQGQYQPSTPTRYELAKNKGSFRYMTMPNVRDALVFRHISDEILKRSIRHKVKGAYYSRRHSATPIGPRFELHESGYSHFLDIWLRYQEYRTRTLLNSPYEILIVTDITNYFDSIQHELLMEYLAPLGLPRKAIALLGRLLEVLKPMSGHSPNPRVGLPVDELDCSRQIAHVFLFEHDRRVVEKVGEDHYVRWMDDQNIGAKSMTEAREVVNRLAHSLLAQRLTLNSGKTLFLTTEEVVGEFHLDTNQALTKWAKRWKKAAKPKLRSKLRLKLKSIWDGALNKEKGHWDKILKRFYGYVVQTGDSWLDELSLDHLIKYPDLHDRIFESFAKRGQVQSLTNLFRDYIDKGECLFEATEASFFNALLLANATSKREKLCLDLARDFIGQKIGKTSGRPLGIASAVLCYYWFGGDVKHLPSLLKTARWGAVPEAVVRSIVVVTAARTPAGFTELLPNFVGYPGDDVGRLVHFIEGAYKGRMGRIVKFAHPKERWPLSGKHYDARAWLCLEILAHSPDSKIRLWLKHEFKNFAKLVTTRQERRVASRIRRLLR